jgi:hypothetical protein
MVSRSGVGQKRKAADLYAGASLKTVKAVSTIDVGALLSKWEKDKKNEFGDGVAKLTVTGLPAKYTFAKCPRDDCKAEAVSICCFDLL